MHAKTVTVLMSSLEPVRTARLARPCPLDDAGSLRDSPNLALSYL